MHAHTIRGVIIGLFSGRKALASSTFLGIGANPPADPSKVPAAPAAAAGVVPGAPAALPAPPASTTAGQPPAAAKSGKSSKKGAKKAGTGGADDEEDEEEDDNEDEDGDDDSDEEEMRRGPSSTICRARSRERTRIGAIMGHASAAKNLEFAAHIALNTNMGRQAACALLDRAPAGTAPAAVGAAPAGLAARMEQFRGIAAPPNAPNASTEQVQNSIVSEAFAKHAITAAKKA